MLAPALIESNKERDIVSLIDNEHESHFALRLDTYQD